MTTLNNNNNGTSTSSNNNSNNNNNNHSSGSGAATPVKKLILCGLFAALTAVCSQIAIPLPFTPVPINLATLSVLMAGGLLGARYGATSQFIYLCLGLAGLPVFAQLTGGAGILFGPTGGYILGYVLSALLIGFLFDNPIRSKIKVGGKASSMRLTVAEVSFYIIGLLACYIPGTLWFMTLTDTGLLPALVACVFPFLPGEVLKIAAALILTRRIRPLLKLV